MSERDVRALASRIHVLEERVAAVSRARQLTSSSVPVTVDGDEGPVTVDVPVGVGISQGVQALADAATALATAETAERYASGAVSFSEDPPTTADAAGKPLGALWTVVTSNKISAYWELTALGWVQRPLDTTVIPQINIGTGTFGVLSGARLAVDAIDGMTVTGATLRTAASGQRMQFDVNGLIAYNASGVVTAAISAGTGGVQLKGQLDMSHEYDARTTKFMPGRVEVKRDATLFGAYGRVEPSELYFSYGDASEPGAYRVSVDEFGVNFLRNATNPGDPVLQASLGKKGPVGGEYSGLSVDAVDAKRVLTGRVSSLYSSELVLESVGKIKLDTPVVEFQGDTGWIPITGWTGGFTPEPTAPVEYRIRNKEVIFRGSVFNSSWSGPLTQFNTLPVAIRPPGASRHFSIAMNSAVVRTVFIRPDGAVFFYGSGPSGAWWSFDAVRYTLD